MTKAGPGRFWGHFDFLSFEKLYRFHGFHKFGLFLGALTAAGSINSDSVFPEPVSVDRVLTVCISEESGKGQRRGGLGRGEGVLGSDVAGHGLTSVVCFHRHLGSSCFASSSSGVATTAPLWMTNALPGFVGGLVPRQPNYPPPPHVLLAAAAERAVAEIAAATAASAAAGAAALPATGAAAMPATGLIAAALPAAPESDEDEGAESETAESETAESDTDTLEVEPFFKHRRTE